MLNRTLAAGAFALAVASPAAAQLRDVRVASAGERAQIAIALEGAPRHAAAMPISGGFLVQVAGGRVDEAVFESARADLVQRIEMRPQDDGASLAVFTTADVLAARADIHDGAVRVHLALSHAIDAPHSGGASATAHANAASSTTTAPSPPSAPSPAVSEPAGDDRARAALDVSTAIEAAYGGASAPTIVEPPPVAAERAPSETATATPSTNPEPASEPAAAEAHDSERADAHSGQVNDLGGPTQLTAERPVAPEADHAEDHIVGDAAALYAAHLDGEACAAAEGVVRNDPWDLDALNDFGACLMLEGDLDQASTVFARLLSIEPEDVEAHLGLGVARQEVGDVDAARAHYDDALAFARTDAAAARARALLSTLNARRR